MKLPFYAFLLLCIGCTQPDPPLDPDVYLRQNIIGGWQCNLPDEDVRLFYTFHRDGHFLFRLEYTGYKAPLNVMQTALSGSELDGTYYIEDNVLHTHIEGLTKPGAREFYQAILAVADVLGWNEDDEANAKHYIAIPSRTQLQMGLDRLFTRTQDIDYDGR